MQKLRELWVAFLNALHLYTFAQHDSICKVAVDAYEVQINAFKLEICQQEIEIRDRDIKIKELEETVKKLKEESDELRSTVDPLTEECQKLSEKVAANEDAARENLVYVKDVQKQLSRVLHESDTFGFPRSTGIPGSSSISSCNIEHEGEPYVVVRGRTIVTDDLTKTINDIPDMGTRIRAVMDFMQKYGVFARIGRDMFSYGAAQCVLGYSEQCTNYELYYEIVGKQVNAESVLVVRNPEKKNSSE